jgi:hypothetical protein
MADRPRPRITLDDESENWIAILRLERLRAAGWRGTVYEYAVLYRLLGGDPLKQEPPITSAEGYSLPPPE